MPRSKPRNPAFVVTVILCIPLAVLVTWPQAFGLQRTLFIAQAVAFRAPLALAVGVGALIFAAVAVGRRRWAIAAAIAVVLGVASVANAGVLLVRGSGGEDLAGDLTVVAWNAQGGAASPSSVASLVRATDADIVSLPEMDEQAVNEVARLLAADGYRMTADTTGSSHIPTSVLIADHLGEFQVDGSAGSTPGLPSAVWRSVDGTGPAIVAAHTWPPLPTGMHQWEAGLRWVAAQCSAPDVIIAGDLNATVDHMTGMGQDGALIGGCRDALSSAGARATGTWPTTIPAWLASPIDHVLIGSAWTVRGGEVLTTFDDAGADHRPIVVVLSRR